MKKLLIVVDYQVDFVDGALGFAGAELLDERIAAKVDAYHAAGDVVAFTFDTHQPNYLDTLEGRNLPVPHCLEGTPGWQLFGRTAEARADRDPVFRKPSFGSPDLFAWLREANQAAAEEGLLPFERIELVGLVSNICVVSNAVLCKTAAPEVPVVVDATCTASFDPALNDAVLDVLAGLQVQVLGRE